MVITLNKDLCLYQGASGKKDAPTHGWLNICEYYYKMTLKVFWIPTHFVKTPLSHSLLHSHCHPLMAL